MDLNIRKEKANDLCLLACIYVWIFSSVLFGRTTIESALGAVSHYIYQFGRYAVYAALAASILCCNRPDKRMHFWCVVVTAAVLAVSVLFSREVVLISILLFTCAARNVRPRRIVMTYFAAHLSVVAITLLLCLFGDIDPNVMHRGSVIRRTFGFNHPNAFGGELCVLSYCYLYLRGMALTYKEIIAGYVITVVLYLQTDCRTAFMVLMLILTCVLVLKYFGTERLAKYLPGVAYTVLGIVVFAGLFFSFFDNDKIPLLNKLDQIFSYRFDCMYDSFKQLGVSLFGTRAKETTMLDNSFVRVFFVNGAVTFVILVAFCGLTTHCFSKSKNVILLLTWCAFILMGFMENTLFRVEYNWAFLVAGSMLLSGEEQTNERFSQWLKRMVPNGNPLLRE